MTTSSGSKTSSRKMEEDLANVEFETSEDVEVIILSFDSSISVRICLILIRLGGRGGGGKIKSWGE